MVGCDVAFVAHFSTVFVAAIPSYRECAPRWIAQARVSSSSEKRGYQIQILAALHEASSVATQSWLRSPLYRRCNVRTGRIPAWTLFCVCLVIRGAASVYQELQYLLIWF
jgi:hypothetical protein